MVLSANTAGESVILSEITRKPMKIHLNEIFQREFTSIKIHLNETFKKNTPRRDFLPKIHLVDIFRREFTSIRF